MADISTKQKFFLFDQLKFTKRAVIRVRCRGKTDQGHLNYIQDKAYLEAGADYEEFWMRRMVRLYRHILENVHKHLQFHNQVNLPLFHFDISYHFSEAEFLHFNIEERQFLFDQIHDVMKLIPVISVETIVRPAMTVCCRKAREKRYVTERDVRGNNYVDLDHYCDMRYGAIYYRIIVTNS